MQSAWRVQRQAEGYCLWIPEKALGAPLYMSTKPYDPVPRWLGAADIPQMNIPGLAHRRCYFAYEDPMGRLIWGANRGVEIASVENFRDMGGYPAGQGRTVRWGRFFRCGAIRGLSDSERALFQALGIRHVLDYRAENEASAAPDELEPDTAYHGVPAIRAQGTSQLTDMDMSTRLRGIQTQAQAQVIREMFIGLYDDLPFQNPAYQLMFALLDDERNVPLLQHCSAGKDRTGVGCALLLLALGVDEETVRQDYLLSIAFRAEANAQFIAKVKQGGLSPAAEALVEEMMSVSAEMLDRSLKAIHVRYGSLADFFGGEYGIDQKRLDNWRRLHTVEETL